MKRCVLLALICLGLLMSTVACDGAPTSNLKQPMDGQLVSSNSPVAANATLPPVQVNCPAQGTARAAVMPALAPSDLGKGQGILTFIPFKAPAVLVVF